MKRSFGKGDIVCLKRSYHGFNEGAEGVIHSYYNDDYRAGPQYEKYVRVKMIGEAYQYSLKHDLNSEFYVEQDYLRPFVKFTKTDAAFVIPPGNSENLWKEMVG